VKLGKQIILTQVQEIIDSVTQLVPDAIIPSSKQDHICIRMSPISPCYYLPMQNEESPVIVEWSPSDSISLFPMYRCPENFFQSIAALYQGGL